MILSTICAQLSPRSSSAAVIPSREDGDDLTVGLEFTQVACNHLRYVCSSWIAKADLRNLLFDCEVPRRLRGSG